MTATIRVSNEAQRAQVKILNPVPGGNTHTSLERARRFVANKRAYFDASGRLVFYGKLKMGQLPVVDDRFSGTDARPGRAVYPPSPEVLSRMGRARGPLRPPIAS